jgi:hypothetical protein
MISFIKIILDFWNGCGRRGTAVPIGDPHKTHERKFDTPWRINGFIDDLLDDESITRTACESFYGDNKI